jgi:hypothetical protein
MPAQSQSESDSDCEVIELDGKIRSWSVVMVNGKAIVIAGSRCNVDVALPHTLPGRKSLCLLAPDAPIGL